MSKEFITNQGKLLSDAVNSFLKDLHFISKVHIATILLMHLC
jgi:hypothetical protein